MITDDINGDHIKYAKKVSQIEYYLLYLMIYIWITFNISRLILYFTKLSEIKK